MATESYMGESERIQPVLCRLTRSAIDDLVQIEFESNRPAWPLGVFEDEFANPGTRIYGARIEGELVGFVSSRIVLDEAHIMKFGVRTEWRRRGIGRRLLTYTLEELYDLAVEWAWLEVRAGNEAARNLYNSMGFIETGVRKGYYSDNGEDAVLMRINVKKFPIRAPSAG